MRRGRRWTETQRWLPSDRPFPAQTTSTFDANLGVERKGSSPRRLAQLPVTRSHPTDKAERRESPPAMLKARFVGENTGTQKKRLLTLRNGESGEGESEEES